MNLVQVVPQLLPVPDGVGGYAAALARGLAARGVASRFLVAAPAWSGSDQLAGAPIGERSAGNMARQLAASGAEAVLVHYVNYGYQRRGCPRWLVAAVCRWRAAAASRRLATFFHEVYASGPPWRSSFWLAPVQRRLAARLLRASDGAATSLPLYGRMLSRWGPHRLRFLAPVLSTVGEPAAVLRAVDRRPRAMIVFGAAGNRRRAYGQAQGALAAACRALGIAEVLDVGPALDSLPREVGGVPLRGLGPLPEPEVSAILLRGFAGFLAYPAALLPKSTVLAAYCAHGLVPVCSSPRRTPGLPPAAAEAPPFWDPGAEPAPADPGALAERARAWYAGHDLAHQAAWFHALVTGSGTPRP